MPLILANLVLCLLGWMGALLLLRKRRTFYRWFFVLLMSIWLYISVMLLIFALNAPLYCLLGCGLLPVLAVAYGYRVFDYYRKRAQAGESVPVKLDGWLEELP